MNNEEAIMSKQNVMHLSSEVESNATQIGMKELLQEIQATPKEHWSNLLQMVRLFRESVTMKSGETWEPEAEAIGETSALLAKQHQALRELTRQWIEEGDEEEQTETWEYLRQALDVDRLDNRIAFP